MSADTPSDSDVLLSAIRGQLAQVHTCLPGRVLSYDAASQTATVQPTVRFKYRDAATRELVSYDPPAIANVPVAFPGAGDFSITWPLAAGDAVTLLFAERSLDEWRSVTGNAHEPKDVRRFDLSDAIAVPGGRTPAAPIPAAGIASDTLIVRSGALTIKLNKLTGVAEIEATSIKLGSAAVEALVKGPTLRALYNLHTHGGVTVGAGVTGPPIPLLTGAEDTTKAKGE